MGTRTLLKRIEQAEKMLKTRSVFSADCICFPENDQPSFGLPCEEEIAAKVKCPLHGERFKRPQYVIYVSKWLREKLWRYLYIYHTDQYRKAWFASFPPDLWPAEELLVNGKVALRLKDGTTLPTG